MIIDKNGDEIKEGDEIIVRAKVMAIHQIEGDNSSSVLQVKWQSEQVPLIDYVLSSQVEKAK